MEEKLLREYKIMYIMSAVHATLHLISNSLLTQLASFGKTFIYLKEQPHYYPFLNSAAKSP
jgi:hypothetical protein